MLLISAQEGICPVEYISSLVIEGTSYVLELLILLAQL